MNEPTTPHALSNRTTPTWEVELLISGVAVFAMLQLPGQLDDALFALEPRFGGDWRELLKLVYIYAKSAALILAVTFVLHLLLRARWIALVGMHSVHPDGIRLDALDMGPIQREIEEASDTSIPERIERADNLATTVFAIGVMLATMLAGIAVVATTAYGMGVLAAAMSHGRIDALKTMIMVFCLVMVPYSVLILLDRYLAPRWPADARSRKVARTLLRGYTRIGFSRSNNTIMALLASHGGDRKAILLTTAVMFVALVGSVMSLAMLSKPDLLGNYALFPQAETRSVDAAHYDDQRDPARDPATPYIQSAVVAGPYLKLVVPYRPRFDEPAMRRSCASVQTASEAQQATERLACLQRLRDASLDGKPVAGLHYEIASDPRTDRPALLAMIDVRDLPRGRHELRIARPLRADRERRQDDPDPGYDAIPFWR